MTTAGNLRVRETVVHDRFIFICLLYFCFIFCFVNAVGLFIINIFFNQNNRYKQQLIRRLLIAGQFPITIKYSKLN